MELGRTIFNFARLVPGGLLVFFPSYPALESATTAWKETPSNHGSGSGSRGSLWQTLESAKPIIVEPKQVLFFTPPPSNV